ncbi:MAG: DUF5946 family protein [Pseudolabrys sp.]
MTTEQDKYHELSFYTLAHPDRRFIHQHVVDAFAAQHADQHTKAITIVFALIGLYLYVEKNLSGRDVQRIHARLAETHRRWPDIEPPVERGTVTVSDVLATAPGPARDDMIRQWCASVWAAWKDQHDQIRALWHDAGISL